MALLIPNISRLSSITTCRQLLWPRINCYTFEPKAGLKQSIENQLNLPARPKKPITPFFRFSSLHRQELKEKHPGLPITEISKKLAKIWEMADPKMKQELNEQYKKEMDEFSQAKINYSLSLTEEQKQALKQVKGEVAEEKKKRRLKKKSKELGKPKRPGSSFILFAKSRKDQRGDTSVYDWQLKLSREWEQMSDSQKQPYVDQAKRAFINYSKDIEAWEANMIKEGHLDVIRTEVLAPKAKKPIKK